MSPTKHKKKIMAWSYSTATKYEGCPAQLKYAKIDKLPEPKSANMKEGSRVHMLAQAYTTGAVGKLDDDIREYLPQFVRAAGGKLPEELECFGDEFKALRKIKRKLMVEQELAFTQTWAPTPWFDPWGSPPLCWVRIKMDLMYQTSPTEAKVVDYKTGKPDPKHKDQLSLYAIAAFLTLPRTVQRIDCELWFLAHGEVMSLAFTRDQLPALISQWEKRTVRLLADTTFKPTPGNACRWCHYRKDNKGPCKF